VRIKAKASHIFCCFHCFLFAFLSLWRKKRKKVAIKEVERQSTTASNHFPHGPVSFKKTIRTEIRKQRK